MIYDISIANGKWNFSRVKEVFYNELIKLSIQYNTKIQLSYQVLKYDKFGNPSHYQISFLIGEQEFNDLDELKRALQNKVFL